MNHGPLGFPRPFGVGPLTKTQPSPSQLERRVRERWDDLIDAGIVSDITLVQAGDATTLSWHTPHTDIGSGLVVDDDNSARFEIRLPRIDEADREAYRTKFRTVKRSLRDETPMACSTIRLKFNDIRRYDGLRPHVNASCRSSGHAISWAGEIMRALDDAGFFVADPV